MTDKPKNQTVSPNSTAASTSFTTPRNDDLEAGRKAENVPKAQRPSPNPTSVPKLYNPRRPWNQYQMGYPRFAAFIADDKDRSATIYRRFERLAARNLLYLESELAELEAQQDALDEQCRDVRSLRESSRSWRKLRRQAPEMYKKLEHDPWVDMDTSQKDEIASDIPQDFANRRLLLAYRIRKVLKEYYEALKLESDILALSAPDDRSIKAVRKIFKNYNMSTRTYGVEMIGEEMADHVEEDHKQDLCVLAPPVERDRLTRLLEGRLAFIFRKRTPQGSTYYVPEQRVKYFVTTFSILAAAAFLIGAISGLYVVQDPTTKLWMTGLFTVGFAGALGLLTNARRQDVFAATAAYAAVLVVFISGSLAVPPATATTSDSEASSTTTTMATVTATVATTVLSLVTSLSYATIPSTIVTSITSTLSPDATSTTAPSSGLAGSSVAAIVGGVVGGVGGIVLLIACYYLWGGLRSRKTEEPRYVDS